MQPELIISLILFALVGVIVSMDVAGLTLSKTEEFCSGRDSPMSWSLTNACWHAGLLGLYVLVISGILTISPELMAFVEDSLRQLWSLFPVLPEGLLAAYVATSIAVQEHLTLILGVLALAVVWRTYSAKIVSRPEHADIDDLPILARTAFNVVDLAVRAVSGKRLGIKRIARIVNHQAQAALVAVDMLALAILLKSIRYIEKPIHAAMAVGIVWVVVFFMTLLACRYGIDHFNRLAAEAAKRRAVLAAEASERGAASSEIPLDASTALTLREADYCLKSMEWVRITLRLAEPFLIFYFALQLVSMLLLGRQAHGVSLYIGAGLLLWALVDRWSLERIIETCLTASTATSAPTDDTIRPLSDIVGDGKQLLLLLGKALASAFLAVFLFACWLWLRHGSDVSVISFEAELSYIFTLLGVISAGAFFPRLKRFVWIEEKMTAFLQAISANRRTYVYMAGALFIATVFPVYSDVVGSASSAVPADAIAGIHSLITESHRHALQVGVWLAFFFVLASLIDRAEERAGGDGDTSAIVDPGLRNRELRRVYGVVLTFGSLLLGVVGWLQQLITT